jgi:hypothetical protein
MIGVSIGVCRLLIFNALFQGSFAAWCRRLACSKRVLRALSGSRLCVGPQCMLLSVRLQHMTTAPPHVSTT